MLPLFSVVSLFLMPQVGDVRLYSLPTSEEVTVATMAARDDGYEPNTPGTFLDEMRDSHGQPLYPGYKTIVLYSSGNIVHSYSIRIQTGDIADAHTCQLFAYPDLLKFRQNLMTTFGTSPVSPSQIADELGCSHLDIVRIETKHK
jgi:hypothetical protein